MKNHPWWLEHVEAVLEAPAPTSLDVGELRYWQNRVLHIYENVEPQGLRQDFELHPALEARWLQFLAREQALVQSTLAELTRWAASFSKSPKSPEVFWETWQKKGFTPHALGAGTPADDFLDGLFQIERLTQGEAVPAHGTVNMASRAARIDDFLTVTQPTENDVVMDLGSGNGKLALTVAASTQSQVFGVEWGAAYVKAAQETAARYSLSNVNFLHADVRAANLAAGNIFYLYYPFSGEVAHAVAQTLGNVASEKAITVYASGPQLHYGEYFLELVEAGKLCLSQTRGEFSEVMVLKSPPPGRC